MGRPVPHRRNSRIGQSADLQLSDVDRHLDLQVGVLEHNSGHNGQYCEAVGRQNMDPHVAHSSCFAQNYARATTSDHLIDLDARPPWATSWTEHTIMTTLEVPATSFNGLVFSAPAFNHVSYH